jgi:uncharacterized membrane protein YfcA
MGKDDSGNELGHLSILHSPLRGRSFCGLNLGFATRGADLKRTGAMAGLVAGALGATAYAFHCGDDSIPFIAIWYGAMVALCAFIGALLGPRLLRW